jgi:hypothetical protein
LRGGVAATSVYTTESIGVALGYDADIGSKTFVGGEFTADTNTSFDTPVYGVNRRLGVKTSEVGKLVGTVGAARYKYDGFVVSPLLLYLLFRLGHRCFCWGGLSA